MEDIDTNVVNSLFAIKKNQLKLVERRGYNIERERALLSMTLKDFINSYVALANKKKQTLRQILHLPTCVAAKSDLDPNTVDCSVDCRNFFGTFKIVSLFNIKKVSKIFLCFFNSIIRHFNHPMMLIFISKLFHPIG